MSSTKKNALVGLTVLLGLAVLGWMILAFGDRPVMLFAKAQMTVHVEADRADGLAQGSQVLYRGVSVGRVERITRADNQRDVLIDLKVDHDHPPPANVVAVIRSQGGLSAATVVSLDLTDPQPMATLQEGQTLPGHFAGAGIIPPEVSRLAEELRLTVRQLRESNLVLHADEAVQSIRRQADRVGDVLDSLHGLVNDDRMRQDLRQALANFRAASENARNTGAQLETFSRKLATLPDQASATVAQARSAIGKAEGHMDTLAKGLNDRLLQAAATLENLEGITRKMNKGTGTAGMLVNDPKLYQTLVEISLQLNATVADVRRLVQQWEQEGVTLKLNK